jgi:hypothetical protein
MREVTWDDGNIGAVSSVNVNFSSDKRQSRLIH